MLRRRVEIDPLMASGRLQSLYDTAYIPVKQTRRQLHGYWHISVLCKAMTGTGPGRSMGLRGRRAEPKARRHRSPYLAGYRKNRANDRQLRRRLARCFSTFLIYLVRFVLHVRGLMTPLDQTESSA